MRRLRAFDLAHGRPQNSLRISANMNIMRDQTNELSQSPPVFPLSLLPPGIC